MIRAYWHSFKVERLAAQMLFDDHFKGTSGGLFWKDVDEYVREPYRIRARKELER